MGRPRNTGAAAIRIIVGNCELWLGPQQQGLIPAPVESYLGRGSHQLRVAGAPGGLVIVMPPH